MGGKQIVGCVSENPYGVGQQKRGKQTDKARCQPQRFLKPSTEFFMKTPACLAFAKLLAGCLLFTLVTNGFSQGQGNDAAERRKIIGVWQGAVVEGDGSKQGSARQRISELVITADKITARDARGVSMGEGTYRLSVADKLKAIDTTGTAGPTQGKSFQGIYTLEGDTLKWCSGNDRARTRPAELKTNTGNGHFLMILTRKKQ